MNPCMNNPPTPESNPKPETPSPKPYEKSFDEPPMTPSRPPSNRFKPHKKPLNPNYPFLNGTKADARDLTTPKRPIPKPQTPKTTLNHLKIQRKTTAQRGLRL